MLKSICLSLISILCIANSYASDASISPKVDEASIQELIARAKSENEIREKEVLSLFEKADATINETLNSAETAIDAVEKTVFATGRLGTPEQDMIKKESKAVKQEFANLRDETSKIISEMRENYLNENAKILKEYDKYSMAISDYYAKKMSKEELMSAGNEFKEKVAASEMSLGKQRLAVLKKITDEISIKVKELQEDVLNKISNSREYSDEDEPEEKTSSLITSDGIRYVYNNITAHNHTYLKSLYADSDQSFLMSTELVCDELDISQLEKSDSEVEKFRDCVTRAKTEKEYFALKSLAGCSTHNVHACDPFKDELYADYSNKGVYNHILEDYDTANVVNIAKTKQYAHTWQGEYEKKSDPICDATKTGNPCMVCVKGTLCEFSNKVRDGTITSSDDANKFLATVELEAAKLWSSLRRVDALHRSKKGVNYFTPMQTLYLDGRDDGRPDGPYADAASAASEHPGVLKVEEKDQDVAPNVLLYVCKLKAEDISMDPEDPADEAQKEKAEKAIVKCMKTYAKWVDKGTDKDKLGQGEAKTVNDRKKLWKEKEYAAATDSMFKNITVAAINLYKSSLDYAVEPPEDGINITSLQKGIGEKATQVMDGYAAGAKINYYTTNQILSIVDADALELQTEIIQNMNEMSYNFFNLEEEGGN